jgi:hypothetical protein
MKALFSAVELLGDLVEITPTLYAWKKANPEYEIELRLQDQPHCHVLENLPGIAVSFIPGDFDLTRNPADKDTYDFFHLFAVQNASKHSWRLNRPISEGYAVHLNDEIRRSKKEVKTVNLKDYTPILPTIDIYNEKWPMVNSYISVTPFCGGRITTPDGGGDRPLGWKLWNSIFEFLTIKTKHDIAVLGHDRTDWTMFDKYVKPSNRIHKVSIPSVKDTIDFIFNEPRGVGFISPDSGYLHCVSGGVKQLNSKLGCMIFLTKAVPTYVSYPYGIPKEQIIVSLAHNGDLKFTDIRQKLYLFTDII